MALNSADWQVGFEKQAEGNYDFNIHNFSS